MLADIDYTFHQHDETTRRREADATVRVALTSRRSERHEGTSGRPWRLIRRLVGAAGTAAVG
jgi:hypothetical protein